MRTFKTRSHCPGFQSLRRTMWTPGPTGTISKRRRQAPHWIGIHCMELAFTGKWCRWFQFFKQPGLTGAHQAAKQRKLITGHHRSSSSMNRFSTVRPPSETVANRHELCPLWRYGDSRLGYGVSRKRTGVAPTLIGRTAVWHGSSLSTPVKIRLTPIQLHK